MARARTAPTVAYNWAEPDPDIVAQQILQLSYALEDFQEPLLAAAGLVRQDIRERFTTGTDPIHRPWDPWAESYAPWAQAHTTGPRFGDRANLHLTGVMEGAVLSPSNWRISDDTLFLDTTDLPEYWAYNNFGADREVPGFGKIKRELIAEGYDIAKGFGENTLPERAFIGLTPEAQSKINAVFDAWFANEVAVATSSKGTPFFRHTKMGYYQHPKLGRRYGFLPRG